MKFIKYSRVYYPGYLGISNNSYFHIKVDDTILGLVTFRKHHTALEFLDLNSKLHDRKYQVPLGTKINGLLVDKKSLDDVNFDIEKQLPDHNTDDIYFLYDLCPLPRAGKNTFFTELLISREYKEVEDKEGIVVEQKILERFISKYRELSKDINIKLPSESNWNLFGLVLTQIVELKGKDKQLPPEKALLTNVVLDNLKSNRLSFDMRDFRKGSKPTFNYEDLTKNLKKELNSGNELDRFLITTNKVHEEMIFNKNYKYSLLEIFIFCESFVTKFLFDKKIDKGISKKRIQEIEVTFSYLLNIELPLFIDDFNEEWKKIIGDVNWLRKKRNDVVHNAHTVTEAEAKKALMSVEKLIKKLKNVC